MSEQQIDSKNGVEFEKSTANEDRTAGTLPEDTVFQTDNVQTGRQNPEDGGESALESEVPVDSSDEAIGEWPDGNENSDNEPDYEQIIAELEAKSVDLAAQLAELNDQLLRKAADFENFRKRINQEKQNAIEFANQSLLLDIIPIIDDFERAIQSAETSEELTGLPAGKAVLEGITMIEKRLISRLEGKWGLKRFNSAGEPFDPNFHEAVLMDKSPDTKEPVVQEEFLKGYMLKERVIRAAQVKVLMPENSEQ